MLARLEPNSALLSERELGRARHALLVLPKVAIRWTGTDAEDLEIVDYH